MGVEEPVMRKREGGGIQTDEGRAFFGVPVCQHGSQDERGGGVAGTGAESASRGLSQQTESLWIATASTTVKT